jgi:sodium/potassium-transporting ATPase subunit alpha
VPIITNVIFGIPQILSSFLMIIICCLTDCAAAIALAYEKPEADVLMRPPRNVKTDRLADTKLICYAYLVIGMIQSVTSFAMSYWYVARRGIPFSALWFKFGDLDPQYDPDYVTKTLAEASSIYFVNLVVMQFFNLMAVRTRRLSIFQHPPLFNKATQNYALFPAMLFAIGIIFVFCYIPQLQTTIGTAGLPAEFFFFPVAFGLGLLFIDEARKWWVRKYPKGFLAKIAW